MKSAGLLFGLNYKHMSSGQLDGCIQDVRNVAAYLKEQGWTDVTVYTDESNRSDTSHDGMIHRLQALADRTWKEQIDIVWIHYSGHGGSMMDWFGEEKDGKDECLCPSDYDIAGSIKDDTLCELFRAFNPKTYVIMVTDACHSATMGDLKYIWNIPTTSPTGPVDPSAVELVEETLKPAHKGRIVMISGCMDNQISADVNFGGTSGGALTTMLLRVLKSKKCKTVFEIVAETQKLLKQYSYSQVPQLTSSCDLRQNPWFLPTQEELRAYLAATSSGDDTTGMNQTEQEDIPVTQVCVSCFGCLFKKRN